MKNSFKSQNIFSNKKNLPLLLTGILTLFLFFVFGSEQFNEQNPQSSNFANELYSATLKPLFSSDNIDKKDILKFAVKGNLPLYRNNRVLQVGKDREGRETLEIILDKENIINDEYSLIVDKLQLTVETKVELDSILKSYQKDISTLVYFGNDSLIAVDPKIGLLRSSINNDLSTFIREVKYNLSDAKLLNEKNRVRLYDAIRVPEKNIPRQYIVFTPDSVIHAEFHLFESEDNQPELNSKIKVLKTPKRVELITNDRFSIELDSNFAKITLDSLYNDYLGSLELNLFNLVVDSTLSDLQLSFEIKEDSAESIIVKFGFVDSSNNTIKYEMSSDDIGTAISKSLKLFSGKDVNDWIEYGIKMDSISRAKDSIKR